MSVPWHPAPVEPDESESTRGDIAVSPESQRGPPEPGQKLAKSASLPRCEASIPSGNSFTQGSGAPACTGGVTADLLRG